MTRTIRWFGLLFCVLAGTAEAEEAVRTAAFALPMDEFSTKAAGTLTQQARDNLRREKQFDLIDIRSVLNKDARDPRQAILDKARQELAQGRSQYDELELDSAVDSLGKAVQDFKRAVGLLGNGQEYIDALLLTGAAHVLAGNDEQGLESFRLAALYNPEIQLDPKKFPPGMIEVMSGARASVKGSPVGLVQLKSEPPAAEVYLNGVYKGITPLTLADVPEGTHLVRIERDGYLHWGEPIQFWASREERVEATLQAGPGLQTLKGHLGGLLGNLDDDSNASAIKFGQWLGVERLLIVNVRQRSEQIAAEGALYQIEPPRRLGYQKVEYKVTAANAAQQADSFMSALYGKASSLPPPKPGPQSAFVASAACVSDADCVAGELCDEASGKCIPEGPQKAAIYEKWWFWTIVGGGLLVAGGAGVLTWYLLKPDQGAIEFTF